MSLTLDFSLIGRENGSLTNIHQINIKHDRKLTLTQFSIFGWCNYQRMVSASLTAPSIARLFSLFRRYLPKLSRFEHVKDLTVVWRATMMEPMTPMSGVDYSPSTNCFLRWIWSRTSMRWVERKNAPFRWIRTHFKRRSTFPLTRRRTWR